MGAIFKLPVSKILEQAAEEWLRNQLADGLLRIVRAETDEEADRAEREMLEMLEKVNPHASPLSRPLDVPDELLDGLEVLTGPQLLRLAHYAVRLARISRLRLAEALAEADIPGARTW